MEIAKHHTEVDYGTQESAHLSRAATERLHADFEKRLKITFALFIAAAIGNAADAFLQLHVFFIFLGGLREFLLRRENFTGIAREIDAKPPRYPIKG